MNWKTAVKNALPAWLCSRLLLLTLVIFTHSVSFTEIPAREERNLHPELWIGYKSSVEALRCVFSSADASWYFRIAESGYDSGPFTEESPKNWTFFPLFPLSIAALDTVTGSSVTSGFVLANLCFFASLLILQAIAEKKHFREESLRLLPWLVCFFPTSYFFSSPLTESLFLLVSSGAWLALLSDRVLVSGLLLSLASATRPTGFLILPAFVILLFEKRKFFCSKGILAALIAPLGGLMYMLYLYHLTGDAFAFAKNQLAWNRGEIGILEFATQSARTFNRVLAPWNALWLNLGAGVLALCAAFHFLKKRDFSTSLLIFVPTFAALLTGTSLSLGRFVGDLFPTYLFLLAQIRTEAQERAVLVLFASLFAAFCILYAAHVTAGMA